MVELRLDQIAKKINGLILQGSPSLTLSKFNIDSRLTEPGELFFALVANRDGHDFVLDAVKKGAAGAVISKRISLSEKNIGLVKVEDTLQALQKLAKKVLTEHKAKIVGITGSTGKTTTKEFSSSLLSASFNVLKSEGNFNNYLGLPLSILRLNNKHEVVVLEMAMSSAGEIRTMTQIAPPDISVITNISPVHLQFFKSLDEIREAKKEILEGMKAGGTAVLNGDDPQIKKIARDWKGEKIFFGFSPESNIRAQNIRKQGFKGMTLEFIYGQKQKRIHFPFIYESFLYNFLAAAAIAYALSVPLKNILEQIKTLKPFPGRGILIPLKRNIKIFDDSYNSNPKALEAALRGLSDMPSKRKVAVLGDMLELGKKEAEFHRQAGEQVVKWGWDLLITIGRLSASIAEGAISAGMNINQVHSFQDSEEAATKVWSLVEKGDFILVKGSRKIRTEKVVEKLKSRGI